MLVTTQDARPAESRIDPRIDLECALSTEASALGTNLMLAMAEPPVVMPDVRIQQALEAVRCIGLGLARATISREPQG